MMPELCTKPFCVTQPIPVNHMQNNSLVTAIINLFTPLLAPIVATKMSYEKPVKGVFRSLMGTLIN